MPKIIQDEFTDLPISAPRKWQLRQLKAGKCCTCGKSAIYGGFCSEHLKQNRTTCRNIYRKSHGIPVDLPLLPKGLKYGI